MVVHHQSNECDCAPCHNATRTLVLISIPLSLTLPPAGALPHHGAELPPLLRPLALLRGPPTLLPGSPLLPLLLDSPSASPHASVAAAPSTPSDPVRATPLGLEEEQSGSSDLTPWKHGGGGGAQPRQVRCGQPHQIQKKGTTASSVQALQWRRIRRPRSMEARRRQRQRCPTPSDAVRQRAVVASLHKISVHHDVLVRIQATCDMLGSLLLQAMGNQSELHFYRSASTSLATGLLI